MSLEPNPRLHFSNDVPEIVKGILQGALNDESRRLWIQQGDPTTGIAAGYMEVYEGNIVPKSSMRQVRPAIKSSKRATSAELLDPERIVLIRESSGELVWRHEHYLPSHDWSGAIIFHDEHATNRWQVLASPAAKEGVTCDANGRCLAVSFGSFSQADRWLDKRKRFEVCHAL